MSEPLDETNNTLNGHLSGSPHRAVNPDNILPIDYEPDPYQLDKNAMLIPTPTSPVDSSSYRINNDGSKSTSLESSIYSYDSMEANASGSPQSRMFPERLSADHQALYAPEEDLSNITSSISDYEISDDISDDESHSTPAPETYHAKYRKSGPDLMTLHMFTGTFTGNRPRYVPVYKRDESGKLMKLGEDGSGHWGYTKVVVLSEDEIAGGLKKKSKPEAVLQTSGTEKAVGRRTLADFGLPETDPKGGWGWL